ncbi:MAG: tetratricopeptide repeat protein [bacterium]|nr:tetratricopeptide repeat protein [bacterium]
MKKIVNAAVIILLLSGYGNLLMAQSSTWANYYNKAISNYEQKNYVEALEFAEEALKSARAEFKSDNIYVAKSYRILGRIYSDQKRYKRANIFLKRALTLFETLVEPDSPELKGCLTELANLYINHGNYPEAEPVLLRVYETENNSDDEMKVAHINETMATLYRVQGYFEKSEPYFEKALEVYENSEEIEHDKLIRIMEDFGGVYLLSGKFDNAISLFSRALDKNLQHFGDKSLITADSYVTLARAYDTAGRQSDAEDQYNIAYKLKLSVLGFEHFDVETLLSEYNGFLSRSGKKIISFNANPKLSFGASFGFFNSFQKRFNKRYHYRPMVTAEAYYKLRENVYAMALFSYHSTDKIHEKQFILDPAKKSLIQIIQNYGFRVMIGGLLPVKHSVTWISSGMTFFDVTEQDRLYSTKMVGVNDMGEFIWADITYNRDVRRKAEGYFIEIGQLFQGTFKSGGNSRGFGIRVSVKYDSGKTTGWDFSGITVNVGGNFIIR